MPFSCLQEEQMLRLSKDFQILCFFGMVLQITGLAEKCPWIFTWHAIG